MRYTYEGAATAILEIGSVRLLTDPAFDPPGGEYRAAPLPGFGCRKLTGPALEADAVGPWMPCCSPTTTTSTTWTLRAGSFWHRRRRFDAKEAAAAARVLQARTSIDVEVDVYALPIRINSL